MRNKKRDIPYNSKVSDNLKPSGVCFLFENSDQTGKDIVYIGKARARKKGNVSEIIY